MTASSTSPGSSLSPCVRRERATMLRAAPTSAPGGTSINGPDAGALARNCLARRSNARTAAPRTSRIPRTTRDGVDEQQPPGVRVALERERELAQRAARLRDPVAVGRGRRLHHQQPLGRRAVGSQQTGFLVLELLVEGRAGDPRLRADLRHRQRLRTVLGGQRDHRLDQALTLVAGTVPVRRRAIRPGTATRRSRAGSGRWCHGPPETQYRSMRDHSHTRPHKN